MVAALLLTVGSACIRPINSEQAPPGNEPFKAPREEITQPASGEPLNLPKAGTYRYGSAYVETGNDHKHNETLVIKAPVAAGKSTKSTSWWRQDSEIPWFEVTSWDERSVRMESFSLAEARQGFCALEPPMLTFPRSIGVGSAWSASSVCSNDIGFKRYMTSDMKVARVEAVTVGQESLQALVIEGQIRIVGRNSTFTLGVERHLSLATGLMLKETLRFAGDTGNGRIDRSLISTSPS